MSPLSVFQRVLVPTDFSAPSNEALDLATRIADPGRTELVLVYVVEPRIMTTGGFAEHTFSTFDSELWVDAAQTRIRDLAHQLETRGFRARTLVRVGRAFEEIVQAAGDEAADLIVIGSAGHSRVTYAILGSTVERVARLAPCPVLITRPKRTTKTGSPEAAVVASGHERPS